MTRYRYSHGLLLTLAEVEKKEQLLIERAQLYDYKKRKNEKASIPAIASDSVSVTNLNGFSLSLDEVFLGKRCNSGMSLSLAFRSYFPFIRLLPRLRTQSSLCDPSLWHGTSGIKVASLKAFPAEGIPYRQSEIVHLYSF